MWITFDEKHLQRDSHAAELYKTLGHTGAGDADLHERRIEHGGLAKMKSTPTFKYELFLSLKIGIPLVGPSIGVHTRCELW